MHLYCTVYILCRYGKVKNQVRMHTFLVMCTNVLHSPAQVSEIHMRALLYCECLAMCGMYSTSLSCDIVHH